MFYFSYCLFRVKTVCLWFQFELYYDLSYACCARADLDHGFVMPVRINDSFSEISVFESF